MRDVIKKVLKKFDLTMNSNSETIENKSKEQKAVLY